METPATEVMGGGYTDGMAPVKIDVGRGISPRFRLLWRGTKKVATWPRPTATEG